jgi:hypothetical protein
MPPPPMVVSSAKSIPHRYLRSELRDALEGLRPGELSQIVKLPSGCAVLKVLPESEIVRLYEVHRAR